MTAAAELTFAPPGPGVWMLETSHFTRPATRFHAEVFPEQFVRGFGESLRRYGSLLEHLDWAFVNGFPYYCPRPVGAPPEAVGHPPRDVWEQLAKTHPGIRERQQTSATVFERRLWRVDLDRCRENQKRGAYLHHLFNVPALLPVGDLLVHCQEWTGRPATQILALLQGFSPDPLGADEEIERLRSAIERDGVARALLDAAPEPAELLVSLRRLAGETGAAAGAYIDAVGWRPVNGEDVGEPNAAELPELIVGAIRSSLEGSSSEHPAVE